MKFYQVKRRTLLRTEEGNLIYIDKVSAYDASGYFIILEPELEIEKTVITEDSWKYLFDPQDLIELYRTEIFRMIFKK